MQTFLDLLSRGWEEFVARTTGPLKFRFVLQPLVVILLALRAGWRDAREGRPPFLKEFVTNPEQRTALIYDLLKDVGKVVLIATFLDIVYQMLARQGLQPLELLFTVVLLAVVPYVILRGPASRLFHRVRPPAETPEEAPRQKVLK